ncbi:hypothetical protein EGN72_10520 [Pseudorhodobacter sp. E13]|uniref:hypothetical protein n=1 Tax=Pseudorhodobacter sp. E13 TaxID=2487931 RepID=UPI000F8C6CCE|nr:hypothetical protein [Pseudorhodobacter sp. E13]RUS60218.1 hypothetical protein EGN72_10520 [Pseudorhodobacter sp. E13]
MLRTLLLSALMVSPAVAQDEQMMGLQLRQLTAEGNTVVLGAYAACILGKGDVEATAALFTQAGWTRTDDSEMGVTELAGSNGVVAVTLYDGGRICSVTSEVLGTASTESSLVATLALAGWPITPTEGEGGCAAYVMPELGIASLTSSGQDPVCQSDSSSDARFTFGL